MNRVTLDTEALHHNLSTVHGWVRAHGAKLTVVTKALCGFPEALRALQRMGVRSMGDSRLLNLKSLERSSDSEMWYLRPPHPSALPEVLRLCEVSLNTELEVIKEINAEAARRNKLHRVIVMIELGDLREGILPGSLVKVYREVFDLPNIELIGIGANLGCLSGTVPSIDQLMQLVLYRELLELKFDHKIPLISAGSSAVLPMLLEGRLPRAMNHFRVGESIFLGTDLINGGTLKGLRDDVVLLEAEVVELKEKSLVPLGETADLAPFKQIEADSPSPGQRGYRAVVTIGQLDADISSLRPVNPEHQIAGASSDLTVVNLGSNPKGLRVGDSISFRVGYSAFVRLMSNPYTERRIERGLQEYAGGEVSVPPVAPRTLLTAVKSA